METLLNIIDAMLNKALNATMNEFFMINIFFYGLMLAMLVVAVSVVRLGIQFFSKKAIK